MWEASKHFEDGELQALMDEDDTLVATIRRSIKCDMRNHLHMIQIDQGNNKALSWKMLSHMTYKHDLAPSYYHLFASMGIGCMGWVSMGYHLFALAEQCFTSYENGLLIGVTQKSNSF
ncbi:hypothetical protein CEXT_549811 [Caerostris extrusa]|uniref:Uncharacterized protein n=1 Tax=Caerostris extrusa TaxID=172846 RepID=A0AAV4SEB8_CAEEX|nr:hypothetical protein CEXT_549811 [Caerostris extrusa]